MELHKFDYLKKYLKVTFGVKSYQNIIKRANAISKTKRAVLIGTPIHSNLGDHLIAAQCAKFINTLNYDDVIEIPEFVYELFSNNIHLQETDDIYIAGGGWMGDLYEDQLVIESMLKQYKNNKIFILPQTVHFTGQGRYSSPETFKKYFHDAQKAIITLRDKMSYEYCINNLRLSENRCYLLPDMALLSLEHIASMNEKDPKKIIFSLRHDIERISGMDQIEDYYKILSSKGYDCSFSSTIAREKIISISKRDKVLEQKRHEFGCAELIITDRLHSMIMALSAGTKCIAIDNSTHKVKGVYDEWLKNMPGLYVFSDVQKVDIDLIVSVMNSNETPISVSYEKEFDIFKEKILKRFLK